VCDFFVSNIYASRVDVADKETIQSSTDCPKTASPLDACRQSQNG